MRKTMLDPSSSPAAAFGVQLRRSREAKGLTQRQLGALIGFSNSFVSCIERATRNPTHAFATKADEYLETGGTLELMWWNLMHTALLEGFPEYAAHEARAVELRMFELGVIPGLFQTRAYAEALARADVRRGGITQEQAEERVAYLLTRQHRLTLPSAPLVHAVLDESCLQRFVGGNDVMDGQLEHLAQLSDRPNVLLQVAPFTMGERRPFALPVYLVTLADRTMLGYTESQERGYLTRETDTVREWARDYDRLQVGALSDVASLELINAARKGLRP
ncbi:helix-turn-helix transcriptional regulator [Kitasatospora sp. MAP5-34]|uniref:helix-turn-helix domain-containing protein n=1 Tax=Kitasatospora sp. MAP5-34 TaxID=3035102 RepID=UPI002475151C|nr:helix-turn-helix transcriptional regulator [Kitasatospora sp. MAP5-34]MDH6578553.1 transcriptional regulator with XRE-family HTH domain [Kitasatospora sp. MAP5-34]